MFDTNVVLTYCSPCWISDQITKKATWKEQHKVKNTIEIVNFIFNMCHRKRSLTNFSVLNILSGFLFIKEGGDRSHSS